LGASAPTPGNNALTWGAQLGDVYALFSHISVPVITRLKQPERQVLDTLVDAGVARSRSDALSWAVKLLGEHAEGWLSELRTAMIEADKLRSQGPELLAAHSTFKLSPAAAPTHLIWAREAADWRQKCSPKLQRRR
jgi:hypothetical protein